MRERLTLKRIADAACKKNQKQAFFWDVTVPRLGVRVTERGKKTFIFESKINGESIRWTIGMCHAWTIEEARAEACRLQNMIDRGLDPREERAKIFTQRAEELLAREAQKADQERRLTFTLKALCETYVEHLLDQGKARSAQQTASIFSVHIFKRHPDIAGRPANEITSDEIADIVRCPFKSGMERTASMLRAYLHAAFGAAARSRYDARLPAAFKGFEIKNNPVSIIPAIPTAARNRVLTKDELRRYLAALDNGSMVDAALKVSLFAGGQRIRQVLAAKIGDYDREAGTLKLLDPKGRRSTPREHILPLGPVAVEIVEWLLERALAAEENPAHFLFVSRGGVVHFDTPGHRVTEICKEMAGEPFTIPDIRRTCETMLAALGVSRDVRAQVLSHGLSGVQDRHYDRHTYLEEKRAALLRWEAFLTELQSGGGGRQGNVILFRRKQA